MNGQYETEITSFKDIIRRHEVEIDQQRNDIENQRRLRLCLEENIKELQKENSK